MKAYYDKILFILGLLILGAGIGFYFMKAGQASEVSQLPNQQPTGAAYEAVEPPQVDIREADWLEPAPQDNAGLEQYYIFTPPKIYWDPIKGQLTFEPIRPPEPPVPFGLELVSIEREQFRIQLEAHFEGPSGKPEDAIWQFYNSKLGESVRGNTGESFPEHGFKIISGNINKVIEEDEGSTTVKSVPTVIITDLSQDGREITLTTESKLFLEGKLSILMETVEPNAPAEFSWDEVGDTYESGSSTYTLLEIDFDNQSVTVEKSDPALEVNETETLFERKPTTNFISSQPSQDNPADGADSEMSQGFESLFN